MSEGNCDNGSNGCVPVQNLGKEVAEMRVQQNNNCDDLKDIWKTVNDIRGVLIKFTIAVTSLTALIQIGLKFWKV